MAWENVRGHIKTSARETVGPYKLKQLEPWFDEECLGFLGKRTQAKIQWLQDRSQINVDNLNNLRREAGRHFRKKEKEYLKAKIEELEINSKIKKNIRDLYRGINDLKNGYQPRTNIVKDEKGDLFADSHSIWLGGGTVSLSY